jgi:hypothetical protein
MSCIGHDGENQSEFDFLQELIRTRHTDACCGPMVEIGFTKPYLTKLQVSLTSEGYPTGYLDKFNPQVLDSSQLSLEVCSRHWIDLIKIVGKIATQNNDKMLLQMPFFIFRILCLTNRWDHKELLNYLKTFDRILDQSN